ncbi:MAG: hypothetical protein IPO18_08520 [bacterium]|nr:hypothetical protein [bacterium]
MKLADFELLAPLHGHADWPQLLAAAEAALAPQGTPGLSFTMPVADLVPEGICRPGRRRVLCEQRRTSEDPARGARRHSQ